MQGCYTKLGKVLTIAERRLVERWKAEGHSHRQIAGLLGKVPQTINNEVKRGLVRQQVRRGTFELVYRADYAQAIYQENRAKSVRSVRLTKQLKARILHYWKQKYSSEMIVKAKGVPVPVSTIYYMDSSRSLWD